MNEHQARNEINYNTVMSDRSLARSFGLLSWKERRRKSASGAGVGPRNPYKTSGRREMRSLLESLRTFRPSPTHPRGNRATRRGVVFNKGRQEFGVEEIYTPPKRR